MNRLVCWPGAAAGANRPLEFVAVVGGGRAPFLLGRAFGAACQSTTERVISEVCHSKLSNSVLLRAAPVTRADSDRLPAAAFADLVIPASVASDRELPQNELALRPGLDGRGGDMGERACGRRRVRPGCRLTLAGYLTRLK